MGFISFKESVRLLETLDVTTVGVQKLPLQSALGRILAQDIIAKEDSPGRPTSAMDGYAIIGSEQQTKKSFRIVETNPAGRDTDGLKVSAGTAIKTFTGALMPEGADTLVPIENVTVEDGEIFIDEPVPVGFSVRPVGENFKKNEVLIENGSRIGFAESGVMASLNVVAPLVYQRPKVGILATGSEVLELGECSDNPSQIRSSNNYTLEALVLQHGGEPVQLGSVHDERSAITDAMKVALDSADIVVTTGGVSVGDYDFVKDVIRDELGCEVLFKGVRIKPGQHVMVAQRDDRFIVALPGFAYSSTVTFLLYVLPILYKMMGREFSLPTVSARITDSYRKRAKGKTEFVACNLSLAKGEYICSFEGKRSGSSAILTNLLGSAGLLWLDEEEDGKEPGDFVRVVRLE